MKAVQRQILINVISSTGAYPSSRQLGSWFKVEHTALLLAVSYKSVIKSKSHQLITWAGGEFESLMTCGREISHGAAVDEDVIISEDRGTRAVGIPDADTTY